MKIGDKVYLEGAVVEQEPNLVWLRLSDGAVYMFKENMVKQEPPKPFDWDLARQGMAFYCETFRDTVYFISHLMCDSRKVVVLRGESYMEVEKKYLVREPIEDI